jgi:probable rRNA maturation factor
LKIIFINNKFSTAHLHLQKLKKIIYYIVDNEGYKLSSLSVYFTNRKKIIYFNQKYLNHNFPTDIITFDFTKNRKIFADLIICIPVIRENSKKFNCTLIEEFFRIVIHGVLHVTGYNDVSHAQYSKMKKRENFYLELLKEK